LAAIELIPDIVRVIDEAEAQRQQIVMFEETLNTYTNAARQGKQNLNPGGVVSDDYRVKEFICQSVDVVNLLGRRVDEFIRLAEHLQANSSNNYWHFKLRIRGSRPSSTMPTRSMRSFRRRPIDCD
jgi:hypothetical protein